jgi:hypothetical protein
MDTQDPPVAEEDPDAYWALPALERLRQLPSPSSGLIGDEHYHDRPPLRIPDRPLPPPPKNMEDQAAVKKWLDHCWALRNLFGSGN